MTYCEGIVRPARAFGEALELHTRMSLGVFDSALVIDDKVADRSFHPTHHAILYHLNYGYPFLAKSLKITGLLEKLSSELAADPPVANDAYGERVDAISSRELPGVEPIELSNPDLALSIGIKFNRKRLTRLAVWCAYQAGIFALGTEDRGQRRPA